MDKNSKILKWSVIIGIVIVLNLFFNYTIDLFYEEPKFENFCVSKQKVERIETEDKCLSNGGQWIESGVMPRGEFAQPVKLSDEGYCNRNFECSQKYDEAREIYNKNIFIVLVLLGVVSIVVGIFVGGFSEVVATGLSYGGVLSLVIASMRYWSDASSILRFAILLIALMALIWFAIKKFRK